MADPRWPYVIKDLYGVSIKMTPPNGVSSVPSEFARWEEEITRGLSHVYDEDICDAIRFSVDCHEDRNYKGKPTARDVRIWIFAMWKAQRKHVLTDAEEAGEPEIVVFRDDVPRRTPVSMATLMHRIDQSGEDPGGMWAQICSPISHIHCRALEEHAIKRWQFDRSQLEPGDRPHLAKLAEGVLIGVSEPYEESECPF